MLLRWISIIVMIRLWRILLQWIDLISPCTVSNISTNRGGCMKLTLRKISLFLLIVIIQLFLTSIISFSQEQKYPRGAQYFLGTDDQLLIKVNIWGFVANPGQYLVPSDTDLISLISFAGGPREGAKLNNIKLIRAKKSKEAKDSIININVKKYIKTGEESLIPQLNPGDTIIVSGSKWYHFSNFVSFITKIATLVQIYWWIVYYSERNR